MGEVVIQRDSELSRFNALTFGNRSKYDLLPWEDGAEYAELMATMMDHHVPIGPTETHLVQEIANCMWRKQRLRLTEGALLRASVSAEASNQGRASRNVKAALLGKEDSHKVGMLRIDVADALSRKPDPTELAEDEAEFASIMKVYQKLGNGGDYASALKALGEHGKDYEADWVGECMVYEQPTGEEIEHTYKKTAESLTFYLKHELLPHYRHSTHQLQYGPDVALQVIGEAVPLDKLEQVSRYETTLDRKLERSLAMLIKLQDMRRHP